MTLRIDDALRSHPFRPGTLPAARDAGCDVVVAEDVRALGRPVPGQRIADVACAYDVARSRALVARVVVQPAAPPLGPVDGRVRAGFAAIAAAPTTAGVVSATTHAVDAPRAHRANDARGYCESPAAPRARDRVHLGMVLNERAIASLRDKVRAVAADDVVRAHCPHTARAGDDFNAVSVAIVVDVLALCPGVLGAPEMAPYVDAGSSGVPPASDASDLASLFAPLAQNAGMGLQALGGLLTNPVVIGILAPLLATALAAALPGVGVLLAPLLPFVLPLVGQQLVAAGSNIAGAGVAGPLDVSGVAGAFAGAV